MSLRLILDKIKEYETITLYGHKRPDGDCLGSQFGMKGIINASFPEKKVYCLGDPSEYVGFVGELDTVSDDVVKESLAIVMDVATQERVADQRFKLAKEIIKIDHHIPVDNYGNIRWVDEWAPACCQMVTYFYYKFKDELKITKEGARALYTGIVTDSGQFRYRGVTPTTFQMASLLLKEGADVNEVDSHLSKSNVDELKIKGYVYSNFVLTEGGFAYIKIPASVVEEYNVSYETAAAQVNLLAGIENHPVWALFIEYPQEIRVRMRSNGPEIASICEKFPPGGGHEQAAGCRISSFDDIPLVVKAVEEHIKNWKNKK